VEVAVESAQGGATAAALAEPGASKRRRVAPVDQA